MIDRRKSGTVWLFVKASLFTLLVPGTVVVLLPYLLLADASLGAIEFLGIGLLGLLPLVLGAALYLRCAYDFVWSGRGTPLPIDPPIQLVMSGPYRYSRNPMYVGILAILAGEALLYSDLHLLYFLLAMTVLFNIFILGYEERALGRQFGEAYARYCEAVPRWIPDWSGLKALYYKTFARVALLPYVGGTIIHILRLIYDFPLEQMPNTVVDWVVVVIGGYAGVGLIVFANRVPFEHLWDKVGYGLLIFHLDGSVVFHVYLLFAGSHDAMRVFPYWYSFLAVGYFIGLGLYVHRLNNRLYKERRS